MVTTMNNTRPLCSGFRTVNGIEYEIQVFSADDGYADEVCANVLLENGLVIPYEPADLEDEIFQMLGQEIYEGWIEACYEL
jgi:hypothetical protein